MTEFFGFTEAEVRELCRKYDRSFEEIQDWYDGYELSAVEDGKIKKFGQKMILYPLIQLIGAIIPTIYRLYVGFVGESVSLQVATVVCGAIQGILYPISYGWNSGLFSFVVTGCKKGIDEEEEDYDEEVDITDKTMNLKIMG